jgi:hypothetical protein
LTFTPTAGTLTLTVTGDVQFAQLEIGAFATSFIPSAASQVTRAADNASMIGNNFARWYNVNAGTLFVDCQATLPAAASQIVAISDSTINNRVIISSGATSAPLVVAGGATQAAFAITSMVANIFAKTAVGLAVDNIGVSRNGAAASVDTSCLLPVVDRMFIGNGATGSGASLNGTIARFAYYNRRLANTELVGLTS